MSWYWIVALSLIWIVFLYAYSYQINRVPATPNRIDPLLDGLAFYGYMALCVSWPIIVLWQGLIDAAWYVWVLLAVEVICLFFQAVISGKRLRETHTSLASLLEIDSLDMAVGWIVAAAIMVLAPLAITLNVVFGRR
jgi:hypothetical protein